MKLTIIESPFRGKNAAEASTYYTYALRAIKNSLFRDEAPFASHLLYTLVLDDEKEEERSLGINIGHSWISKADQMIVMLDYGISSGMREGIRKANAFGLPVLFREIGKNTQNVVRMNDYWTVEIESGLATHHFQHRIGAPCYGSKM